MAPACLLMILPSLVYLVAGPIQAYGILQSHLLLFVGTGACLLRLHAHVASSFPEEAAVFSIDFEVCLNLGAQSSLPII